MRIKEMLKYLFMGISWGCTFFLVICLIGYSTVGKVFLEPIMNDFSTHVFGSMFVGICCGSTSYVYEIENLSFRRQIGIHFGIAIPCYLLVSYQLGLMPVQNIGYSVTFIIMAIAVFIIIWLGFYLYDRHEATRYNERIKELEQDN